MAYDSTTDTSLQTLSIESDDYSQMSAPQSPCDPADDGKESRINEETLRWNGFSEDPAKEEKRLEIYKANRRQRYYELAKARAVGSRYYAAKVENIGQWLKNWWKILTFHGKGWFGGIKKCAILFHVTWDGLYMDFLNGVL